MSRDGAVDVAALAERVAALEASVALVYRVGDHAEAECGTLAADVAAVREAVRLLAAGASATSAVEDAVLRALDAPAPDPAPDAGGRDLVGAALNYDALLGIMEAAGWTPDKLPDEWLRCVMTCQICGRPTALHTCHYAPVSDEPVADQTFNAKPGQEDPRASAPPSPALPGPVADAVRWLNGYADLYDDGRRDAARLTAAHLADWARALPPALDDATHWLMIDAARALDAANYTDESVTYQENKDRRAALAARLRAAAGPTP